jgi:hypothetical protein
MMNPLRNWFAVVLFPLFVGGCVAPSPCNPSSPVLTFQGAGFTELGVVSVTPGIDRGSVEWHLVADQAGEERVTALLEERFGMRRIHN